MTGLGSPEATQSSRRPVLFENTASFGGSKLNSGPDSSDSSGKGSKAKVFDWAEGTASGKERKKKKKERSVAGKKKVEKKNIRGPLDSFLALPFLSPRRNLVIDMTVIRKDHFSFQGCFSSSVFFVCLNSFPNVKAMTDEEKMVSRVGGRRFKFQVCQGRSKGKDTS